MANSGSDNSSRWLEIRPSRINVAKTHSSRLLNNWGNSKPYLSGDLFADESDVSFFSPKFRRLKPTLRQIREARVVFCPSSKLELLLETYSGFLRPKILICGNDDRDFHALPINLPDSLKHVFLQNSFIPNSNLVTAIPIGLENLRWGKNGFPRLMRNEVPWEERSKKTMIGPFGLTHSERYEIRDSIGESNQFVELFRERLSPRELSIHSQKFRYVAAARGNGVDTHRHWETVYRGSYALVKRDNWFQNFENSDLPFLGLDSWTTNEIAVTTNRVTQPPTHPNNIKILWWPYWKSLINSKLSG
jgi:hypothetical protein